MKRRSSDGAPVVPDATFTSYYGRPVVKPSPWEKDIPAYLFLGGWFVYQLVEANWGLLAPGEDSGGVAFFAHVGGFIFGLLVARLLARAGQAAPGERWRSTA